MPYSAAVFQSSSPSPGLTSVSGGIPEANIFATSASETAGCLTVPSGRKTKKVRAGAAAAFFGPFGALGPAGATAAATGDGSTGAAGGMTGGVAALAPAAQGGAPAGAAPGAAAGFPAAHAGAAPAGAPVVTAEPVPAFAPRKRFFASYHLTAPGGGVPAG